jgi:ABC-type transporter Mla MlaB component
MIVPEPIDVLCRRVCLALEDGGGGEAVICDVGSIGAPDAGTIEALARLQLRARRLGRTIRLRNASRELQELLAFAGLAEVVPPYDSN